MSGGVCWLYMVVSVVVCGGVHQFVCCGVGVVCVCVEMVVRMCVLWCVWCVVLVLCVYIWCCVCVEVCVCVLVCVCVEVCVWRCVWCGTLKKPVCRLKTPTPNMVLACGACFRHTRRRFECTHGGAVNLSHTTTHVTHVTYHTCRAVSPRSRISLPTIKNTCASNYLQES